MINRIGWLLALWLATLQGMSLHGMVLRSAAQERASTLGQARAEQQKLQDQAMAALERRDRDEVKRIEGLISQTAPDIAPVALFRGQLLYRIGFAEESVVAYEKYLEFLPHERPYLWQLGIAYYDVGRFDEGKQLFEQHREVNPNDVENAIYHWLCVAAIDGVEAANERILPAPNDPRIPMAQVYALYAGTGSVAEVLAAAEMMSDDTEDGKNARLFANLYVGLWHHAHQQDDQAKGYFDLAVAQGQMHYMADVARVWQERLAAKK
jgi:lipoprotein NlpI